MKINRFIVSVEAVIERQELRQEWVTLTEENGKKSNGYGPEMMRIVTVKEQIYEQAVETLDMSALVMTVNNIKDKTEHHG